MGLNNRSNLGQEPESGRPGFRAGQRTATLEVGVGIRYYSSSVSEQEGILCILTV